MVSQKVVENCRQRKLSNKVILNPQNFFVTIYRQILSHIWVAKYCPSLLSPSIVSSFCLQFLSPYNNLFSSSAQIVATSVTSCALLSASLSPTTGRTAAPCLSPIWPPSANRSPTRSTRPLPPYQPYRRPRRTRRLPSPSLRLPRVPRSP